MRRSWKVVTFSTSLLVACSFFLVSANAQTESSAATPPPPHAKQIHLKHVLVIGETKGFEHDSVSAAMAAVYKMGHDTGLWDTTMRSG